MIELNLAPVSNRGYPSLQQLSRGNKERKKTSPQEADSDNKTTSNGVGLASRTSMDWWLRVFKPESNSNTTPSAGALTKDVARLDVVGDGSRAGATQGLSSGRRARGSRGTRVVAAGQADIDGGRLA